MPNIQINTSDSSRRSLVVDAELEKQSLSSPMMAEPSAFHGAPAWPFVLNLSLHRTPPGASTTRHGPPRKLLQQAHQSPNSAQGLGEVWTIRPTKLIHTFTKLPRSWKLPEVRMCRATSRVDFEKVRKQVARKVALSHHSGGEFVHEEIGKVRRG